MLYIRANNAKIGNKLASKHTTQRYKNKVIAFFEKHWHFCIFRTIDFNKNIITYGNSQSFTSVIGRR
ncbi:hypothetical protein SAMN05421780_10983 [Flexibacter flexilis DSM 6793]|uniref:Uncharacterized protein n=1 Tax=Flexibacter flexilis DSM 6793 TaxID=927664 RepID=A0A1I1LRY9_9BACT|nr:hypothetical protein SAMN05421780_10983 [Flexibacter flexilis DSM 6793]